LLHFPCVYVLGLSSNGNISTESRMLLCFQKSFLGQSVLCTLSIWYKFLGQSHSLPCRILKALFHVFLSSAKSILELRLPGISKVSNILFEFAPKEKYSGDNSAFDVAIEIEMGSLKGLVGLECKYTDTFSAKEYSKDSYRRIFEASTSFKQPYEAYIASRFNQLFRGQLIAEALVQNKKYDFCMNGLFCHHLDTDAIETGLEFRKMMVGGEERFRIITYSDFISDVQKLDLSWERREWSMMLWARYCGHRLSDGVFGTTWSLQILKPFPIPNPPHKFQTYLIIPPFFPAWIPPLTQPNPFPSKSASS